MTDAHAPLSDHGPMDPVTEHLIAFLETGSIDPDATAVLDPTQRAELLDALAALSPVRVELGVEATWAEPPPELEQAVIDAVARAAAGDIGSAPGTQDRAAAPIVRPSVDRAAAAVTAAAILSPAAPDVAPTAEPTVIPEPTVIADRLERSERSVHRLRALAVAASFVAVLAAVAAIASLASRSENVAAPPASTSTSAPVSSTTAPPTTAPAFDVSRSLVASDLAPGVTGEVGFTSTASGLRIYFDADGLPSCGGGKLYEGWVKTDQGNISVGTFHGGSDVTLWAGVDLPAVRGFWVSIQDEGNHVPSDQKVVSASLAAPAAGTTTTVGPVATTTAPS